TQISGAKFGAFFYNSFDRNGESYVLYTLSGADRSAFEHFGHPRATPLFGPTFRGEGPIRSDDVLQDPRYGQFAPHHGMPGGHLPVRSYLAVSVVSRTGEVIGGLFFGHPDPGVFTARTERLIAAVAAQAAVAIDNARLYDSVKRAVEGQELLLEAERTARADAERASLLKDEFLATLSHELRTPLNAILGWANLLRTRKHNEERLREGLTVIERNARVQTDLIEDLLDMSRVISGKIRLDVQRANLADVVQSSVASVRHSAEAKGIHLQLNLQGPAVFVRCDPSRLQQCFWNLLSNAIKFTPGGGEVRVALESTQGHCVVRVTDTGQGITPEFLPHVFERFRQADGTTTRVHGGLGIGLSIVKHLVELHGGCVDAASLGEGRGATFAIHLPCLSETEGLSPEAALEQLPVNAADHPSLAGLTILVVDDEPDSRVLVRSILEACGARVLVAPSVGEAMSLVRSQRPSILISDIGMPGEDGYDLIRQVRRLTPEEGGRIPAAALTAFARAEDRTRALRAGYQTHIAKPVEPMELTAVIASLAIR
ncbi:MAG: hybrid sensor histidine kinase/response regulator, partial [Tepidisphaeraceae bacterium]